MRPTLLAAVCALLAASYAPLELDAADSPAKGFRFPGGEGEAGRDAFVSLNCVQCHSVSGVELPDPKAPRRLELGLAADKRFVARYEDLVVAITNPRHVVTEQYRAILTKAEVSGGIEPLMPDLTKDMSARQLMDLVAFLDAVYRRELSGYAAE